jgi:hypothetical protein
MSDQTHSAARKPRLSLDVLSLDTWAVLAATVFVILIVVGVLPRVPW